MKPPSPLISRGLAVGVGHNGGPPIDEPVNDLFVRYRWRKAHKEVWKNPSHSIMMFRLARARAAGVTYEEYVSTLLDTGRHMQAGDKPRTPAEDSGLIRAAPAAAPAAPRRPPAKPRSLTAAHPDASSAQRPERASKAPSPARPAPAPLPAATSEAYRPSARRRRGARAP